jgi:hypothetical protein
MTVGFFPGPQPTAVKRINPNQAAQKQFPYFIGFVDTFRSPKSVLISPAMTVLESPSKMSRKRMGARGAKTPPQDASVRRARQSI